MRKFEDTYRHKGLRKKLIDSLREKGITDEQVLTAMNAIPRHYFLDTALDHFAYEDRAFPIDSNQTISQPYTVAYQTQLLQVKPLEKVLEIGTGSMYQSTVLAEMGAQVFSIERQHLLFQKTKEYVFKKKYPSSKLKFFFGDGFEGEPSFAPYDKIIITCGAPIVPPKLLEQLKPGGFMVIPLDQGEAQRMIRVTKNEDGSFDEEAFDDFSFVPMLVGKNRK
jgi:protein-L-isoaspartate(D-aspartate) O-methyltransferase